MMLFALPGFGDQNYRRCLHQAGPAENVLMSFYYLAKVPTDQVEAYARGGYPAELSWREEQKRCASSTSSP